MILTTCTLQVTTYALYEKSISTDVTSYQEGVMWCT